MRVLSSVSMFVAVVLVAYLAGRHLIPESAVDAALGWVFGLFSTPERMAMLGIG